MNDLDLIRTKIFLKQFIHQNKPQKMKFVIQIQKPLENLDIQVEEMFKKMMKKITDGFFYEKDVLFVLDLEESQKIFQISQTIDDEYKIEEINQSIINNFDQNQNYFGYEKNNFESIGQDCKDFIKDQIDKFLQEFQDQFVNLQREIDNLILELPTPTNMKTSLSKDYDRAQFENNLKNLIEKLNQLTKQSKEPYLLNQEINKLIQRYKILFTTSLREIKQTEQKSKKNQFQSETLTYDLDFNEYDKEILEYYVEYYPYHEDFNQQIKMFQNKFQQQLISFDDRLPQSLKYLEQLKIKSQKEMKPDQTIICLLGQTKVGKNPNNIKIVQTTQKTLVFEAKQPHDQIIISHECNTQTFSISEIEIENFIFIDTPGFGDTNQERRLINQINIFQTLKASKEFILLILFDVQEMLKNKNSLLETINQISLNFGDTLLELGSKLESIILPAFTKCKKEKWEKEFLKNTTHQQLNFLNILRDKIDSNNYIRIYDASYYQYGNQLQECQLDEIKSELINKMNNLIMEQRFSEVAEVGIKIQNIDKQLEQKNMEVQENEQNINIQLVKQLHSQILNQCKLARETQKNSTITIPLVLKLSLEMEKHFKKILNYLNEFHQYIIDDLTNNFVYHMLHNEESSLKNVIIMLEGSQSIYN
ncbi:unnamed protein product [Paramecium sonneborni]|uniref:G domain-containing protein n=1 Tax=Paramecium sonneborni TaxID=65129 RepID=A0A8S1RE05_9CILI|nr:unnamed protein product [Paramecium sonneborni]